MAKLTTNGFTSRPEIPSYYFKNLFCSLKNWFCRNKLCEVWNCFRVKSIPCNELGELINPTMCPKHNLEMIRLLAHLGKQNIINALNSEYWFYENNNWILKPKEVNNDS